MSPLDLMKASAAKSNAAYRRKYGGKPSFHVEPLNMPREQYLAKVADRRARVAELRAQGRTLKQIARHLGVKYDTVRTDAYVIRLKDRQQ